MNVNKKYKIEKLLANKHTNELFKVAHAQPDKKRVVVTNGRAAAILPAIYDTDEAAGYITREEYLYSEKDPATKKAESINLTIRHDDLYCPDVDKVVPTQAPRMKISIDVQLLDNLAKAIGTEEAGTCYITMEIHEEIKAILVRPYRPEKNAAYGVIMPIHPPK